MGPKSVGSAASFALAWLGGSPSRACPLCDTEAGGRVRSGLFGEDFGPNLLATSLPFVISLAIVGFILRGGMFVGRVERSGPELEGGGEP